MHCLLKRYKNNIFSIFSPKCTAFWVQQAFRRCSLVEKRCGTSLRGVFNFFLNECEKTKFCEASTENKLNFFLNEYEKTKFNFKSVYRKYIDNIYTYDSKAKSIFFNRMSTFFKH